MKLKDITASRWVNMKNFYLLMFFIISDEKPIKLSLFMSSITKPFFFMALLMPYVKTITTSHRSSLFKPFQGDPFDPPTPCNDGSSA